MSFVVQALNITCLLLAVASVILYLSNKRTESQILELLSDAEKLKGKLEDIHQSCPNKIVNAFPRIPATHIVSHNENELQGLNIEVNVTFILVYKAEEKGSWECLVTQIESITNSFPKVKILCAVLGDTTDLKPDPSVKIVGAFETEAEAINGAIQRVKTTYFLVLQAGFIIEPKGSDNSIEWLHHAVVVTPGIDIIGGSILLSNKELVIPCYSINLCNWTMTQNYEYRRSFGEIMICDEVSHSFLAKSEIIKKFSDNLLDKNIKGYLYTDFFLRVKELHLTTANRPEVIFSQTKSCIAREVSHTKLMDAALPFSKKHNILQFKDPDKNFKSICNGSDKSICTVENMVKNWGLPKWYDAGMFAYPFVIQQTIKTLELIANQLQKSHISFALRGETLFGAVMTKSVLPWGELKAVQLSVFGSKAKLLEFAKLNSYEHKTEKDTVTMMVKASEFPTSMKVEMVVKSSSKPKLVNIRMNGKLYPVSQDPISELKSLYGDKYLEGKDGSKVGKFSCKLGKHHACLPDAATRGASTYQDEYCEI